MSDFEDDVDDDFEDDFEDEEELEDDDLLVDDVEADATALVDEEDEEDEIDGAIAPEVETAEDDDDDVLDLEEELHPDDVEAPLDALLAERVTAGTLDDEDDDEAPLIGDSGTTKVVPRRDSEFHCSSCFLVLPNHMLADKKKMLCRDCV
jgi:hypothetical protein